MTSASGVRALALDMDGVIFDTERIYQSVARTYAAHLGFQLDQADSERFVGISPKTMWAELKQRYALSPSVEELVSEEKEWQLRALMQASDLSMIVGVKELISEARATGVPVAVVTSSTIQLFELLTSRFRIRSAFSAVVTGDEVEVGKPDPQIYFKLAEKLKMRPRNVVVIEDSRNGILSATQAGMYCIGFNMKGESSQDLSAANREITGFEAAVRRMVLGLLKS